MEHGKHTVNRRSQVYKYFVSYLAILLIPCVLATVTYSVFFNELSRQYDDALISGLTVVMDRVDDSIEKMHHYFFEISNNPLFSEYKSEKSSYNALQLVKLLKVYTGSANYIMNYGFIDGETNHIYTPDGGYNDIVYLKTVFSEDAATQAKKDLLSDTILIKKYLGRSGEDTLMYMFPFRTFTIRNANEYGGFFMLINKAAIINDVLPLVQKDCVVSFSMTDEDAPDLTHSASPNRYSVYSAENQLYLSVDTSSASTDSRLARNRLLFYVGMAAAIVISVLLGIVMSQKHAKPLKRILKDLLPYKRDEVQPSRKNEFEELSDIMDDILDVRFLQSSKIDEQRNTIRQNALTLLLLGFSDDKNLDTLRMIGVNDSRAHYFAFILYCLDSGDVSVSNDKALHLLESIALPAEIEMSIVEIYHIEAIAGIVGFDGSHPNLRERLSRLLLDTTAQNGLSCAVCVGGCVDSIDVINRSYHEASLLDRNADRISIFASDQADLFFWDSSSSRALADLLTVLGNDGENDLSDLVDRVLDEIDTVTTSSLTKRCAYSNMIEALLAFSKHNKPDLVRYLQVDIGGLLTRGEFKSTVMNIVNQYARFPALRNASPADDNLSTRIVSYVAENCCNADMSIELVMACFKISANQVTNIFKTMTGYGFREYVILLRMQKAKELLLGTDVSVGSVAEQTGYRSTSYFIKTFKGYYGVTPIQYKKNSAQFT